MIKINKHMKRLSMKLNLINILKIKYKNIKIYTLEANF